MAEDDKVQKKPIKQEFGALRGKEKAKIEKELSNKQMFGALRGKEKAKIEKELSTPIPKSPPPTPPNKPLPTPPTPPNKPLPTPPVQGQTRSRASTEPKIPQPVTPQRARSSTAAPAPQAKPMPLKSPPPKELPPLPTPPNKPLPTPPVQEQVEAQKKKEMTIKTSIEKIFDDVKKDGKKSEPRPVVGIQAKFSKIPENLKIGAKALGQEMIRKLAEKATKTGDRVVNAAHKIVDKKNKGGRGL